MAFDINSAELDQLSEEDQKKHIQVDRTFDIKDVNFDEKYSVLKKINDLVKNFEMDIYSR